MDARLEKFKAGNWHRHIAMVAVAFFAAPMFSAQCDAQVLRIRMRDGSQKITHSMTNDVQIFAPVRWDIQNAALKDGCLVQWTAETFANEKNPDHRADCELSVQLVRGSRNARWNVTSAVDSTRHSGGKDLATVAMTSLRTGTAEVELSVRFRHPNMATLASGNYQTIVTGTISGL